MSEQNETLADIVAEMRGTDNKCQLATKDGTGCYHCPFGSAASNCLFDKFADRIEAAHKREVDKLNSVIQAQRSAFDAEQDRQRRVAPGNAAAMREALLALKELDFNKEEDCHAFYRIIDEALAKPPPLSDDDY